MCTVHTAADASSPIPAPYTGTQRSQAFAQLVTKFRSSSLSATSACQIFPKKYEIHGHVVVVRLNPNITCDTFAPFADLFAASFAPLQISVVLLDETGITGELRRPVLKQLFVSTDQQALFEVQARKLLTRRWVDACRSTATQPLFPRSTFEFLLSECLTSTTFTTHKENGVRYSFDVSRVMFCSGNTTERMHFSNLRAPSEVVVDMFSGIGYFALPLAMHGGVAAVHALEKNPDSVHYLQLNAVQNRVAHLIHICCGDNRSVGDEILGRCDRVIMGYIPSCKAFLPRAVSFLHPGKDGTPQGIVHYHFLAKKNEAVATALCHVEEELGAGALAWARVGEIRCVKSYAPKLYHFVADLGFS